MKLTGGALHAFLPSSLLISCQDLLGPTVPWSPPLQTGPKLSAMDRQRFQGTHEGMKHTYSVIIVAYILFLGLDVSN